MKVSTIFSVLRIGSQIDRIDGRDPIASDRAVNLAFLTRAGQALVTGGVDSRTLSLTRIG